MLKKFILIIFVLFNGITFSYAQSYTQQHETLPCLNKKFSIVAHIFSDSLGNYGVTEGDINGAVAGMND
jgi:hypothetical protein